MLVQYDRTEFYTLPFPLSGDRTGLITLIKKRFISLREGNGMETTMMSDEERRFMWNLAFFFTIKHRAAAFKAYYAIRSFITYHGIFMAPGYELGEKSIWRSKNFVRDCCRSLS